MKLINKTTNNKIFNQLYKGKIYCICYICQRRAGNYYADCSLGGINAVGVHGSGKLVYTSKARQYKSWKHNRNKQWK